MFLSSESLASEHAAQLEQKIFTRILQAITHHREPYYVYYHGKRLPVGLKNNSKIRLVGNPEAAEVIIIGSSRFSSRFSALNKPILTLDYEQLKRYANAVGAYFWQKGRPNIVMIRSRLDKAKISLPSDFDRYIDNTIW